MTRLDQFIGGTWRWSAAVLLSAVVSGCSSSTTTENAEPAAGAQPAELQPAEPQPSVADSDSDFGRPDPPRPASAEATGVAPADAEALNAEALNAEAMRLEASESQALTERPLSGALDAEGSAAGISDGAPLSPPSGNPTSPSDTPDYVPYPEKTPFEVAAAKAFAPPADAVRLSPDANLWIDGARKRVILDGYVTLREGALEMAACPVGTKEHESVVAVLTNARNVHAALLAIGAQQGTPVEFQPEYRPATGQRIAIWVLWRDKQGKVHKNPLQQWIQKTGTDEAMDQQWVFAGSSFFRDPESGTEYYQADSGDLVCVSNFATATLDLPVESSQSTGALEYTAFTSRIPPRGTPVRLVMVPIPLPSDEPSNEPSEQQAAEEGATEERADPTAPPEDALAEPPSGADFGGETEAVTEPAPSAGDAGANQ